MNNSKCFYYFQVTSIRSGTYRSQMKKLTKIFYCFRLMYFSVFLNIDNTAVKDEIFKCLNEFTLSNRTILNWLHSHWISRKQSKVLYEKENLAQIIITINGRVENKFLENKFRLEWISIVYPMEIHEIFVWVFHGYPRGHS